MKIDKDGESIRISGVEHDSAEVRHLGMCVLRYHLAEGLTSIRLSGHPE